MAAVGPSQRRLLDVRPPARRGDLDALLGQEPATVVLLDGLFGQVMAVPVLECARLLAAGWELWGAASIGALRAAETWSLGMVGVGEVYAMLRRDIVVADDELAVAFHPETHQELTLSLVHVRSIVASLVRTDEIVRPLARRCVEAARDVYWYERRWLTVEEAWAALGVPARSLAIARNLVADEAAHPKARDGRLAVEIVLAEVWPGDLRAVSPGEAPAHGKRK